MDGYFYGWYFKCQSENQTIAVIPAVHGAGRERTCSIQFITEENTWTVDFPIAKFYQRKDKIIVDKNHFGNHGIYLDIITSEIEVKGELFFSNITPLSYDIMGLFACIPFMECYHSVNSIKHRVDGKLDLNGKEYVFENALGYWEGDRGRSFPIGYVWTHSFLMNKAGRVQGSLMLSVAEIPLAGFRFTGTIGSIYWKKKEYRFATYLGARIVQNTKNKILIRQGRMELEVRLLEGQAHPLQAPINGDMHRVIRENVRCRAFYRFRIKGETVFALETDQASFEYEYK